MHRMCFKHVDINTSFSQTYFIHLAIVDAVAGWCLGIAVKDKKIFDALKERVLSIYFFTVLTVQRFGLTAKAKNKKSFTDFPIQLCFHR